MFMVGLCTKCFTDTTSFDPLNQHVARTGVIITICVDEETETQSLLQDHTWSTSADPKGSVLDLFNLTLAGGVKGGGINCKFDMNDSRGSVRDRVRAE